MEKVDKIWFDGKLVAWDDANVHVLSHSLHYGLGVFEGIRCYKLDNGQSAVFRLREHVDRLVDSARILTMDIPWTAQQLVDACLEVVRVNKLDHCYIRPLAFLGSGAMGIAATSNPVHVSVAAWRWGAYLGEEGLKQGIRTKVSSFQRPGVNAQLSKAKACGHYVNSILAKREVLKAGYQEAILLDAQGYVCEASGENLFLVQDGKLITSPLGSSLLGGITRDTVKQLAEREGLPLIERFISRDELYLSDEVFLCGTAAEVTPVREIDDRTIGQGGCGPITQKLQERYFEAVMSAEGFQKSWRTIV